MAPACTIGIGQIDPYPGDIRGNAAKIVAMIREARQKGVEILLLPETAITAYSIGDKHKDETFIRQNIRVLEEEIAPEATGISVVCGFIDLDSDRKMRDGFPGRYNAYAVCYDGKVQAKGRKRLLIDDGVMDDSRHYLPGSEDDLKPVRLPLRTGTCNVGILVCQDLWDDEEKLKPASILKSRGAEMLLVLNSSPFHIGKLAIRRAVAERRAKETGLPVVYCNTVGVQDNGKNIIIYDGGSFVLDREGRTTKTVPQFSEQLAICRLDKQEDSAEGLERIEELHQALLLGISGFFKRIGIFKGVVIGLSGGVDSAVDACLLVEALGKEKVLCLNMPSRFNSETTKGAAANLATNLGCKYLVHPIQKVVDLKAAEFARISGQQPSTLTFENMQARERGNILMQYAQERGFMVVGNGNKTEFQRGYATLYGDIIGALMPLGDVNKLDVYRLGRHLNHLNKRIPEEIFSVKPSAELSSQQNVDEGRGDPFDYAIESPLGVELVENMLAPEEIVQRFKDRTLDPLLWVKDGQGRTVYDKCSEEEFRRLAESAFAAIKASFFKRVQAPPIIVVSKRAFGFDYRETLFNRSAV